MVVYFTSYWVSTTQRAARFCDGNNVPPASAAAPLIRPLMQRRHVPPAPAAAPSCCPLLQRRPRAAGPTGLNGAFLSLTEWGLDQPDPSGYKCVRDFISPWVPSSPALRGKNAHSDENGSQPAQPYERTVVQCSSTPFSSVYLVLSPSAPCDLNSLERHLGHYFGCYHEHYLGRYLKRFLSYTF